MLAQPGQGFISVRNPKQHHLPPGITTSQKDTQLYDVSMFHQLHCLTRIRLHLFTLGFAIAGNNTQEVVDILLTPQADHVYHCLDYLRQAISCAGDMTLEWPREEADGRRFAVDGWGIEHQCVDWVSWRGMRSMDDALNDLHFRRTLCWATWTTMRLYSRIWAEE